jgi:imidazolonepropionase-like amidohydrolase
VARARELGLRVAGGTDGGPGSICKELVELVACGYEPLEAITIATRNSAEALGILDRVGTLEPGKEADLVIVDGDPLADLAGLTRQERLVAVLKSGRAEVVRHEGLRQQLDPC